MDLFIIFCAMTIATTVSGEGDVLSDQDEELIEDEHWFQKFHDCLLDLGPCPDDIKKYTRIVPVYTKTACASCSPKEKELFEKHKNLVAQLYPKMFADLKTKFAPKSE